MDDAHGCAMAAQKVEAALLEVWRCRREADRVSSLTDELIELIDDASALDAVEFHLPQFAHMLIHIANDAPALSALERLVLAACRVSVHMALQFFWLVYANLQEHSPKRKGDIRVFKRCTGLLLGLEQCVVYGYGGGEPEHLRALMRDVGGEDSWSDIAHSGMLIKKGGGTSSMGRRTWNSRFVEVRQRVLYYYAPHGRNALNGSAGGRTPLGSIMLSSAEIDPRPHPKAKYDHYFEVRCRQSGQVLKMRATCKDDLDTWIHVLRASAVLPQPPGLTGDEAKRLLLSQDVTSDRESMNRRVGVGHAKHASARSRRDLGAISVAPCSSARRQFR